MKLSVNLVGHGRYWLAGEEVDESIVPPELRKYAIVEGSEGKSNTGGDPDEESADVCAKDRLQAQETTLESLLLGPPLSWPFPLMDSSEEALPPSRTESKEILGTEENPPSGSGRDTQGTSGGERGKAAG